MVSCNTCKMYSSQMGKITVQLATFSVAEITTVAELGCIGTGLNFLFFKSKTCQAHTHRHYHQTTALGQDKSCSFLSICCTICKYLPGCEEKCSSLIQHLIPLQESNKKKLTIQSMPKFHWRQSILLKEKWNYRHVTSL